MSKASKHNLCLPGPGSVVSGVESSTLVVGSRLWLLEGLGSVAVSSCHATGATESVGCVVSTKTTASRGTGCVVAVELVKDATTAAGGGGGRTPPPPPRRRIAREVGRVADGRAHHVTRDQPAAGQGEVPAVAGAGDVDAVDRPRHGQ